ncbi:MAG: ribonuclease P protein component [Zetaproteobacteria bacterium]|nr:MAG: ribonuclease P protein component [Zetaproteobacteria bacterium]
MKHSFPVSRRLRRKEDFSALRSGHRIQGRLLVLVYRKNNVGFPRLGMAVSRKFGSAVARNRLKRLIREQFRLRQHELPACDILIFPRRHADIQSDFIHDLDVLFSRLSDRLRGV